MMPPTTDTPDPRWQCHVEVDGLRCPDPAVSAGVCPAHERHSARRWRLTAFDGDGTTIHDSRVNGDAGLNDAIHSLEARRDWTKNHRVRVSPA